MNLTTTLKPSTRPSKSIQSSSFKLGVSFATLIAAGLLASTSAHGAIIFTYEAAGSQTTSVSGVATETFNSGSLVGSPVGTWSGGSIVNANVFGGAGGTGKYLLANAGNPAILTFTTGQNYVGFWWSAGDPANNVSFYDSSNNLLASFTTSTALVGLPSSYFGNPNGGGNSSEAYAYLNFTNVGGPAIGKVVFGGSNFELDNVSVTSAIIAPPPTGGSAVPDGGATVALLGLALGGIATVRRKLGAA